MTASRYCVLDPSSMGRHRSTFDLENSTVIEAGHSLEQLTLPKSTPRHFLWLEVVDLKRLRVGLGSRVHDEAASRLESTVGWTQKRSSSAARNRGRCVKPELEVKDFLFGTSWRWLRLVSYADPSLFYNIS